ncbi:hypothetical protein ACYJW8_06585 [Frateuria aurantia]
MTRRSTLRGEAHRSNPGSTPSTTPGQPAPTSTPSIDDSTFPSAPAARPPYPRGYIAGGGRLGSDASNFHREAAQLPGTDQIAHAPYFAMVAVEQQGIGRRVINLIGSLTHATDPHCLNVAVWNGMSPQQQIAHHTSPARIAEYTQRYHCVPPPRY